MFQGERQMAWNLSELARATGGNICGGGLPALVAAIETDTRSLSPNSLFVALRGDQFDGHAFVDKAIEQGCVGVMIDKAGADDLLVEGELAVPALVVTDTLRGYGDLAAHRRCEQAKPVIAITGSNGKTTTKELLAAALSPSGTVHKTQGNFNNLVGLPKTLLACADDALYSVVEMGMNAPGEIARLVQIAQPNVGLVTNVAAAHLEGLKTLEGVAHAKGELFEYLPDNGIGVVNLDDEFVVELCLPKLGRRSRLTYGTAPKADIRLVHYSHTATGLSITLSVGGLPLETEVPLFGGHNAMNVAAAVAGAYALGATVSMIATGLSQVKMPGGRLRILKDCVRGCHVIDDTYNANPASMQAAFSTASELAGSGRFLTVIGDMFEMGTQAEEQHRVVGRAAADAGAAGLWALGDFSAIVAEEASAAGASAKGYTELDALIDDLMNHVQPGDWVVVKGSRGMRMERVVEALAGGSD